MARENYKQSLREIIQEYKCEFVPEVFEHYCAYLEKLDPDWCLGFNGRDAVEYNAYLAGWRKGCEVRRVRV